ncbi:MAG: tetratricopeptide repeat protein, partial [Phycisphaerales bacterium]|nr:tetratricopeptide repeat protein [Phycisphaerales bacterium]
MRLAACLFPCLVLGLVSCASGTKHDPPPEVTTFDDATRARLEANLDEAWRAHDADPSDEMATIWLGRRLAYLGRYDEAIRTFTAGLEDHPDSYRLLRHRGHRYLTTRRFDEAVADLERARGLIEGVPDAVEPDGAPNE